MNPTALQILEDDKFDVRFGEAHLVQAQGCHPMVAVGLKKIAIEDFQNAKRRLEAVQKRVEDELYNRNQEELW